MSAKEKDFSVKVFFLSLSMYIYIRLKKQESSLLLRYIKKKKRLEAGGQMSFYFNLNSQTSLKIDRLIHLLLS